MSDNEYERFEITDYDIANEFNINRPRQRQTKHQAIYGIWADDSDNDDSGDDDNKRRGRRRGLGGGGGGSGGHKTKDYTAPVSFVAGGIQQAGKKQKKNEDKTTAAAAAASQSGSENDENDDDESEDDAADARPAFGRKQPHIMDIDAQSTDDSDDDDDDDNAEPHASATTTAKRGISSNFTHKSHIAGDRNVGAWEQHTRGIGAKLLLQMGYKPGGGLGKDLQGISQPVQAHVRKGRGAIGAYGPETAASIGGAKATSQKPRIDEDVREAKEFKEQMNKWRKNADTRESASGKQGKRYYYKTVEEVIEKGKKSNYLLSEKLSKKLGNVPVIDMTGPERRVLSGYHALGQSKIVDDEELYDTANIKAATATTSTSTSTTSTSSSCKVFAMPELTHNLELIVNMCEQDIIAIDKAEREANDRQAALEHEFKNLQEITQLERAHLSTLEGAIERVEELSGGGGGAGTNLTLARAEQLFLELQRDYTAEYKEFGLGDLAAGVIAPLVKTTLATWQPLLQPTQHIELIKKWRAILKEHETTANDKADDKRNVFDPYSSLVWAGVIPSFRACADSWNPKQHQQMATLLDNWAPLFPTWILDSVLEQLILPRLSIGVRDWDPLTDTVPIHIWILPWNGILGEKMEECIYPVIREKLGVALQAWMPQDRSARAMLTPWKDAFAAAEMQYFLIRHIIPKLQMVLSEFVINPLQQDLELWNQVWEWHELIPAMLMADMLDKCFFPRWMQVLVLWLNQSPDYTEISRWYTGWKSMLSEALLREPSVKEHLRRALEMMHRATDTQTTTITSNATTTAAAVPPPPQPPVLIMDMQQFATASSAQLEFKELVSQKCAELGILFAPLPGRRELGKQIYRVGKLYCYIDRNVCMLSDSSFKNWQPAALAQLLERAQTGIIN